ncbi:MAG: carbon monoxide dehydrogenase [Rhodospirillales bacterium]|nr:carbon monoxide dehydrogenase [Rhodospirillales bacterium]
MFKGHDPYLVALSVAIAILGGYTGFGLAARIRATPGASRRVLLAGAAGFLAVGIWTMHFIGMLAAPLPMDAVYLVLPTIVSFLICVLVVGVSMFFVSVGEPSIAHVTASALLLGLGIASMHYVGIHGLAGGFHIEHEPALVGLAVLIGLGAAYGGLRIFLARQGGLRLALSAVAFGLAVSGMHYTAMYGMHFRPGHEPAHTVGGPAVSAHALALIVAILCFLVAAAFLLFLVPEPRRRTAEATAGDVASPPVLDPAVATMVRPEPPPGRAAATSPRLMAAPLGGLGQPPVAPASRLPVEGVDGTHFIDVADVRSVRADAHYTRVHDGTRERMSPWSISEAEAQLDPALFVRVHRSHIVAIPHVTFIRKEGDGAVVGLDGPAPHRVAMASKRGLSRAVA